MMRLLDNMNKYVFLFFLLFLLSYLYYYYSKELYMIFQYFSNSNSQGSEYLNRQKNAPSL